MKANSRASYGLSTLYHTPKSVGGRSSATPILASRSSPLQVRTRICTAKVFSRGISGEDFAKKECQDLRGRRSLGRRFGCRRRRFRRGRWRFGCRSCCSRWRTRGCRACRGFGCLGLLLARRKERGTGQNADVFFHSVNWKRHIALTDQSEQGSF
jgi:hypothetical protein